MNEAKVSEMSVEQKEYHYRRTASSLEHEVERLRDINKDLLEALRNCVRVLLAPRNACPELMITVGKLAQETIDKTEGK